MNIEKLETAFQSEPKFRLIQAKQAIFKDLISDWSEASTFSFNLREKLHNECSLFIEHELFFSDNKQTVKAMIKLADGQQIEAVLMRHEDRNTVCVSSQIGCPLNCSFCATGKMGFKRNLEMYEITEQILLFARYLKTEGQKITNVVFMGMGEPLLNYDNVMHTIKYLNQDDTLCLGSRRFSISTAGIIEGIQKLTEEPMEINLAFSLHSLDSDIRSSLMPINDRYGIEEVIKELRKYQARTRRKIMFEYIMIDGLNDSEQAAHDLARFANQFICVVNLIPCNKTGEYKPSTAANIDRFLKILKTRKVEAIQRFSYGSDISGACGQLANIPRHPRTGQSPISGI